MQVTVGAWNVDKNLGNPEHFDDVVAGINLLNANITFLGEAFGQDHEHTPEAHHRLAWRLGRTVVCAAYEDKEPHPAGEQYMVALVGNMPAYTADVDVHPVRLKIRNALEVNVRTAKNHRLNLFGVHFDDRSEDARIVMAEELARQAHPKYMPSVAIGKFNAMPRETMASRFLGGIPVGIAARLAPHPRLRSLGNRLHEMGDGTTIDTLREKGFQIADPYLRPTKGIAPLDHLLLPQQGVELEEESYQVLSLKGSLTRAIKATLVLT